MGTLAGRFGYGVAPGAQWMTCRGCDNKTCLEYQLKLCGQFMLCPTLPDGSKPNCAKAPHVINNSWGGDSSGPFYEDVVRAWLKTGIIPVFSQGNSGPKCGTAGSPGDYFEVIGVGAIGANGTLYSFSSKGPPLQQTERKEIKPDISAPGVNVKSSFCTSNSAFAVYSGTSMASPHVAGVVGLMQSTSGKKKLDFQKILNALRRNLDNDELKPTGYVCGGIADNIFPNYSFGYGRLHAHRAVKNIVVS